MSFSFFRRIRSAAVTVRLTEMNALLMDRASPFRVLGNVMSSGTRMVVPAPRKINATRSGWNWESRHSFRELSPRRDASRRRALTDWSRIGAKAAPPTKCPAPTCPASRRGSRVTVPSARAGPWQILPNLARAVSSASWMSGSVIPRTESSPVHVR